jgi:hypothetical protein
MASSGGGNVAITKMFEYTATANQTTFAATYILGALQVFINGLEIQSSQFVANSGTDIVLATGVSAGTTVKIVAHGGADVYNKTQADTLLAAKANASDVYTKTTADTLLASKANVSDVYTTSTTDTLLAAKANTSDVYTKSATDTLLATKQATLVSGTNIKTVNGTTLLGSGDIVTPTTAVNNTLTSTSTTDALSAAQGKALQDTKQATLVSGTNIKTINGATILGSGDIVTPTTAVNNTLTSTSTTDALSAAQGKTLQDTKLALVGGTMTGAITSLRETKVVMSANDISLALGNFFTKTISGATTLTVSSVPAAGQATSFILELTNGGSAVITWFSGVKWAGGTAPTLTSSGVDILGFYSHDGGTTWRGLVLAKDSK